jgi:hypothetical protein
VIDEERRLWQAGATECLMISCCSGAELQLREVRLKPDRTRETVVVLRELYPTKSDLYERARELRAQYEAETARSAAGETPGTRGGPSGSPA